MDAYGDTWVHRLPKVEVVARVAFIEKYVAGKRVVHVGFWGTRGSREEHVDRGTWLHGRLAAASSSIVGIDHNGPGVEEAKEAGYEAYQADVRDVAGVAALGIEPADVVVAGEIIEHLERPGDFLDALKPLVKPDGILLLTTPNAFRLTNVLMTLTGRENMNPDHIAIYSWFTLSNLLQRHGWDVAWCKTYNPIRRNKPAARVADQAQKLVSRAFPFLASGLIMGCQLVPERESADTH